MKNTSQKNFSISELILAAAETGFFVKNFSVESPDESDQFIFNFKKESFKIKRAKRQDIQTLVRLETVYPKTMRLDKQRLLKRMDSAFGYQFLLEYKGEIVAVLYTQPISDPDKLKNACYKNMSHFVDLRGKHLQLISLNVIQSGLGFSHFLLSFISLWAKCHFSSMVAVTRCANFPLESKDSYEDYVFSVREDGLPVDPILRMHVSHGASLLHIVHGYRPEDASNKENGILIKYNLDDRDKQHSDNQIPQENNLKDFRKSLKSIKDAILNVLGKAREKSYSDSQSIRDMGLNSLELVDLQGRLNVLFSENLSPSFLFRYSDAESIAKYFSGKNVSTEKLNVKNVKRKATKIAIIGMDCRFPGHVSSPEDYWEILYSGYDAVGAISDERIHLTGFLNELSTATIPQIKYGGFIEDPSLFDANFFSISPREARLIDPQQRILLEVSWRALESAGINPSGLRDSRTGIYLGEFTHDYEHLLTKHHITEAYYSIGNSSAVSSGRLAYQLGTNGPAITIDTACSSSLVAIDMACRSLKEGEIDLALAGGVNLILSPQLTLSFIEAGMLSPNGKCSTFDESADGYVRAEGCGMIVLKRLEDALHDQDNILAVIAGSSVNQDGASNGLTAPSELAQQRLYQGALDNAGVQPQRVNYIEAHGTGTRLGDPIEVSSLQAVYGKNREAENTLFLSSAKSNIGHTESAAGIAGVIKVVLALQHRILPKTLHFNKLNSNITLNKNIQVLKEAQKWKPFKDEWPLLAAVSSFGFSGTNAHLVIEEAPLREKNKNILSSFLFPISAKTETQLKEYVNRLLTFIIKNENRKKMISLSDLAYTFQMGREAMEYRLGVRVQTLAELKEKLHGYLAGSIEDLSVGQVKLNNDFLAVFDVDDMQESINSWIKKGKYNKLLELWVSGFNVDWEMLYQGLADNQRPRRISAPTYPFAKERYWIEEKETTIKTIPQKNRGDSSFRCHG